MDSATLNINLPLKFEQVIAIINQLPYAEKLKVSEFLLKETKQRAEDNSVHTHFASEKVLAKEWLLSQEDEAWRDLEKVETQKNKKLSASLRGSTSKERARELQEQLEEMRS
ncbi:MAG: hypothetical protein EOM83_07195 [Clostridia bacterium]|nr:hypothetical protein [Clostridia bacterium]